MRAVLRHISSGPLVVLAMLAAVAARADEPSTAAAVGDVPAWTWTSTLDARWMGNVAGGRGTGGVYNSLGAAALSGDLAALTHGGWPGARFEASALWIRGGSVSGQFAGDGLYASNIDGFDSIRLFEVHLEQALGGEQASLRAGALTADGEFLVDDAPLALSNSGFGWPATLAVNLPGGGPVWPTAALGARVRVSPIRGWDVRAAVYDGDTSDDPEGLPLKSQHGVHWQLASEQGAFAIAELQRGGDDGATRVRAGAWMHTGTFEDARRDVNGGSWVTSGADARLHHGTHGAFARVSRRVRGAAEGPSVTTWLRGSWAPADRSWVAWEWDGGLSWTGPLPNRASDVFALGAVQASVGGDAVAAALDARNGVGGREPLPDFERAVEATYLAKVHPRVTVGPDVQWIQHPGFSAARRDAWVVGVRLTVE